MINTLNGFPVQNLKILNMALKRDSHYNACFVGLRYAAFGVVSLGQMQGMLIPHIRQIVRHLALSVFQLCPERFHDSGFLQLQ